MSEKKEAPETANGFLRPKFWSFASELEHAPATAQAFGEERGYKLIQRAMTFRFVLLVLLILLVAPVSQLVPWRAIGDAVMQKISSLRSN